MTNQEHLDTLHVACKSIFEKFVYDVEQKGYKVIITAANRTFQRSQELHAAEPRNAKPGFSKHNYGMAIDINISKFGKIYQKSTPVKDWRDTPVPDIAELHDLRWGGNYVNYYDPIHFEWIKYSTADLLKLKEAQGVEGNKIELI